MTTSPLSIQNKATSTLKVVNTPKAKLLPISLKSSLYNVLQNAEIQFNTEDENVNVYVFTETGNVDVEATYYPEANNAENEYEVSIFKNEEEIEVKEDVKEFIADCLASKYEAHINGEEAYEPQADTCGHFEKFYSI